MNDLNDQQAAMRLRQAATRAAMRSRRETRRGAMRPRLVAMPQSASQSDDRPREPSAGDQWLAQFFDYLIGERGYSEHTLSSYKGDLNSLQERLAKDLVQVSADDIRKFLLDLLESGHSGQTARRKLSAIRSFYQFVFGEGGLAKDPSRHVRQPKAFNAVVRPITRKEVDRTLVLIGADHALDMRNQALVYTAYGSGLRVSELVSLKIADIDFQLAVAKVRLGKGQKDRLVPMNQAEMEAVNLYIDKARPRLSPAPDHGFLFVGRRGEPLTRQRVWQIMTTISKEAVGRPISPHKYRHAFVSDTINGGAAIRVVQKMVGHSNVKTTMNYMHSDPERMRTEYLKSHPRGGSI